MTEMYYTIRSNKKSFYKSNTLFNGIVCFYDYKKVVNLVFMSYVEAMDYIVKNRLSFRDVHIRRTIAGCYGLEHRDYICLSKLDK